MHKRDWLIRSRWDARPYGSDATVLRGWLDTFSRDPDAKVTCFDDSGHTEVKDFLATLHWPKHDSDAFTMDPALAESHRVAEQNHLAQCLSDPAEIEKIFEKTHTCEWFRIQKMITRAQYTELRQNAKLLTAHVDQIINNRLT